MKAARWYGRRDIRVVDIDAPAKPAPGWVLLRVDACGLCGTDVEEYVDGPVMTPVDEPYPLTGALAPLTLGHEVVGTVETAGEGVALAPGTPVAVEGNLRCGACSWCLTGRYNLCPSVGQIGQRTDGGLAEYVLAPAYTCVPYDPAVPAEVMALAEPLSVAVRAVRRGGVTVGARVAVVGAGTIGLLTARVCALAGAESITVIEPHPRRLELASAYGANTVTTPASAQETVAGLGDGHGFDVVFDCAGTPAASASAIRLTRRGGRTVVLGVYHGDLPVDLMDFLVGEKELIASLSHLATTDFPDAVRLLETGRVDPRPLISARIPLADAVRDGFDALIENPDAHLKVLVFPQLTTSR